MARPMPVLPEVGWMMVPPALSSPLRSAASTIDSAMRSLIEPPGLLRSDLIHTVCPLPNRRLIRTCGVLPMVCRMLSAFMVDSGSWTQWAQCSVIVDELFYRFAHIHIASGDNHAVKPTRLSLVQAARTTRKRRVETPHWRNVRTA